MNKNIKQNKENKEKFYSVLVEPLLKENWIKEDLMFTYNYSERGVRKEIQEISMFFPVISYSKQKGYRIIDVEKCINEETCLEEIQEINCVINELQSRIVMLKKKMKPLIATKKVLEKRIKENKYENK